MDIRAEKLAKARKKLKDHQEKKNVYGQKNTMNESELKLLSKEPYNEQVTTENVFYEDPQIQICTDTESNRNQEYVNKDYIDVKPDIVTEMLITDKTNLELQINNLNDKLANLEGLHKLEVSDHNVCQQKNFGLQSEINNLNTKYTLLYQESLDKDEELRKLIMKNQILSEEKNNLCEQLELTKSMLTTKESENAQLNEDLDSYKSKLHLYQLQLQQLTSGPVDNLDSSRTSPKTEDLLEKIAHLQHKIELLQYNKDGLKAHYEEYVSELNKQITFLSQKNREMSEKMDIITDKEESFIEQISVLEKRYHNYKQKCEMLENMNSDIDRQNQCLALKVELDDMKNKYEKLQELHRDCLNKIQILSNENKNNNDNYDSNICTHDVDLTKLMEDIASDKLAAQMATEQNEKLKDDVERLEQVIVKMGKDKLDLTEKWTHEKQLNKGLALKLAEVEESARYTQNQIKAKDDEMLRLLNEHREFEKKYGIILKDFDEMRKKDKYSESVTETGEAVGEKEDKKLLKHEKSAQVALTSQPDNKRTLNDMVLQKEDAMMKLQERFLNIMDEVASLSDEKYRLEHIILQLQNETDTICEYVTLYQQQRSLLKKREEERSNQLKIYQAECEKLKRYLEELRDLLLRFAADEELASFLKEETRHNDFARVKKLLEKLQNCPLINPYFSNLDLNIFYPCSCCSGQLINV